jgi:hypothetical protein
VVWACPGDGEPRTGALGKADRVVTAGVAAVVGAWDEGDEGEAPPNLAAAEATPPRPPLGATEASARGTGAPKPLPAAGEGLLKAEGEADVFLTGDGTGKLAWSCLRPSPEGFV